MFPCPKELTDTRSGSYGNPEEQAKLEQQQKTNLEKYGFKDWYDWTCENWGSKWSDKSTELVSDLDDQQLWVFESAWSPMTQLFQKVSSKYDKLVFGLSFTEEANLFAGFQVISNGGVFWEQEFDCTFGGEDYPSGASEEEIDAWRDKYCEWENDLKDRIFDSCRDEVMSVLKTLSK